jgi:hypothetical protein
MDMYTALRAIEISVSKVNEIAQAYSVATEAQRPAIMKLWERKNNQRFAIHDGIVRRLSRMESKISSMRVELEIKQEYINKLLPSEE